MLKIDIFAWNFVKVTGTSGWSPWCHRDWQVVPIVPWGLADMYLPLKTSIQFIKSVSTMLLVYPQYFHLLFQMLDVRKVVRSKSPLLIQFLFN